MKEDIKYYFLALGGTMLPSPLCFSLVALDHGTKTAWHVMIWMYVVIAIIIPPSLNYLNYGMFKYKITKKEKEKWTI